MKGSPDYIDNKDLQAQRFSEMLSYYFKLMEWMVNSIPETKYQEWKAHILLNCSKSEMIERIKEAFEKRQFIVSPKDLEASGSLEVNFVTVDSPASFERQFIRFENNFTLEDFFTIFHQNIRAALASFTFGLVLSEKDYPPVLLDFHQALFEKLENIKHMSIKLTGDVITSNYNIPLRNHAAKLIVVFNKSTNKIELQFEIYGHNSEGRMSKISYFTNMIMQKFMMQADNIQHEEQAIFYASKNSLLTKFVINANQFTQEHLTLINLMQNMAAMTFDANSLDLKWFLSDFEPQLKANEKIEILAMRRVWKKDQAQLFFQFLFDKIDAIDIKSEKDLMTIFLYPCSQLLEGEMVFCLLGGPNRIGTQREMFDLLKKIDLFPNLRNLRINMNPMSDYLKLVTSDKVEQLLALYQLIEPAQQLEKIQEWDQQKSRFIFEMLLSEEINPLAFSENQLQTLLNCFYSAVPDDINACLSNKQNCQFCDYEELKKFSQKYSNYPDLLIGNVHIADILAKTNANKSMLTFRYGSENKSEPSNVEEIQSPLTQNTKKL